ncbi:hypothetical protein DMB92_02790 [Campylobacter sp. MIT 99-7217]|uniref:WbqC family protein n=1 Tax=Campylobacter sp. MIT 99-7217 TaxID=535091 RepID=UPI001159162D|nr:WbqC family protein [Campylobacter sp. MIT 99-7217]TQR33826.1 hypothetical protein DMB92_02790 [Campylobacter sp. MIT 99-7217]
MKIAIMQPTFLPWIGYFKMIESVDCFVFLDCVQFERRSWQSRNKIKLNDEEFFLSLSLKKTSQQTPLNEIYLSEEEKWKNKLLLSFHHAYSKSVHFKRYEDLLSYALFHFQILSELNIFLIQNFCKDLEIKTPLLKASNLNLFGKKEYLLLEICKALKADSYLSAEGSKSYLAKDEAREIFKNANIQIFYFSFEHPIYHQQGKGFLSYLGVVDFLCNVTNFVQEFKHFSCVHYEE